MRSKMVLPILFAMIMLTGCWDKLELNDLSIITGIAIEKGEKSLYKLTISTINSAEFSKTSAKGDTPSTTFTLEGNSVSELSTKMNVGITRNLIYSHTRILVIDEQIANAGLLDFLDFLERSGEFRNDFNIVISKGVQASDILKIAYPLQKDPSLKIHKQAKSMLENWGGDPGVRLTDFISAMVSEGKHPVTAVVTIKGDSDKGKSVDNNKKLDLDANIIMDGMGVFKHDELIGMMPLKDVRNYLWTEDIKHTNVSVPCEKDSEGAKKYNDIKIIATSSKKMTKYQNGKVQLIVKVIGEADIVGTQCSEPLNKPETFEKYEGQLNKFVEKQIKGTIQKVQDKYEVDIFGFGEVLDRSNHQEFKKIKSNWDRYFTDGSIIVDSKIYIRRSGIRNNSYIHDLKKLKESSDDSDE